MTLDSGCLILCLLYFYRVRLQAFEKGQCLPNQLYPDLIGLPLSLSPHLRHGTLSVRMFYWDVHATFKEVGAMFFFLLCTCILYLNTLILDDT
jgi:hypothetical protein